MKLDKKILEEKIRQYRKTKSCSESTLMGLCETADADITKEKMIRLGCGFAGGIGGTFDEEKNVGITLRTLLNRQRFCRMRR